MNFAMTLQNITNCYYIGYVADHVINCDNHVVIVNELCNDITEHHKVLLHRLRG